MTFGQKNPLKDGWIEVDAANYDEARAKVLEAFGEIFSNIYDEETHDPQFFPKGKLAEF